MNAPETAEVEGTMQSMLRPRCFFVPDSALHKSRTGTPPANRRSYNDAKIDIEAGYSDAVQATNTAAEQTRLAYLKIKFRELYGFITTKLKGYITD